MLKNFCTFRMVLIWTGVVALLFGGSLLLAFWGIPKIITKQIHSQTRLTNGTAQWDRFVELPFPLAFTVRFFEVTNPDAVLNGSKPQLRETEPYTYKLGVKRTNIKVDDEDEDSVTYTRDFTFTFDSSGTTKETDYVTILNPLIMASLQLTSNFIETIALAGCKDRIFKSSGLDQIFINKTVKELLFDGIPFGFRNESGYACEIIRQKVAPIVEKIRVIEHMNETSDGVEHFKIALFNFKRDSYRKESPDGTYTVNRGIDDMTALGQIMRWNDATTISTYGTRIATNNDTCQVIKGTDSTIYRPQLKRNENLMIYNTDLCRNVELEYKGSNEAYQGIKAFRYETSKKLFRPATPFAENDCFCSKATKDASASESCYLDGLFDLQPCLGAPIIVSQPHFLYADEQYVNNVNGLSPNETKHQIYVLIEPNTGSPLEGMRRIQLNSVLRKELLIDFLTPKTMYEGIVPVLWLEEGFSLPDKYVDEINNKYFKAVKIATGLKYGLIATFASLFAACLFIVWRKQYFRNKKH